MGLSVAAPPAVAAQDAAPITWWAPARWPRGDRVAVAILVAVPLVVFALPALAGHAAVVGDNLLQNYPLRVLTGRELRAGQWPTWNPYAFSGTALLGGMNAGSFYPGTLLFAVLPDLAAWVVNLLVVYWAAALGLYALVRWRGAAPLASAIAAATYAFSGAMVGQLVHIGVIQGQSLLPWLVLCVLALGRALLGAGGATPWRGAWRRAAAPAAGLAGLTGLVFLTGEPRAYVDTLVVVAVVGVCELVWHGHARGATTRGRVAFVAASAVATCWGAAIGLVQLSTGWAFVSISERHQIPYSFFQSGSWPARWLPLLVNPGLLGDNGLLGTPKYFASYNLPEVTGAVGLLAAVALFAALAQCCSRRPAANRAALVPFVALCVVGVVLALGSFTPVGHLLYDVPLLGRTRLQNRSIAILDLGAAVLLAWWLDAVLQGRREEAALTGPRRIATLAPLVAAIALGVATIVGPGFVTQSVLGAPSTASRAGGIRFLAAGSFAIAVAYLVALRRRAGRALVAIALVELACFNVFFQTGLISGTSTVAPSPVAARALFGTAGRTAIVDPLIQGYHQTVPLGLANLNVFTGLPSVQGYGSLESQRYVAATGTERLAAFDGCALAAGTFAQLRLASIAVTRSALATSPVRDGAPTTCGRVALAPSATRYLGATGVVRRVIFDAPAGSRLAIGQAHVAVIAPDGLAREATVPTRVDGSSVIATFAHPVTAVAVRLAAPGGVRLATTTVTLVDGTVLHLDTAMQVALSARTWRFVGVTGVLDVFHAARVRPPVWLASAHEGSSAHVVRQDLDGTTLVFVQAAVATRLVLAQSWLPGWTATLVSQPCSVCHGPIGSVHVTRTASVVPDGIVQAVAIPPGTWAVTVSYHAPHLRAGLLTSLAATVALLAAVVVLVVARRRDRTRSTGFEVG